MAGVPQFPLRFRSWEVYFSSMRKRGWGEWVLYGSSNRQVVFRVRVLRDVRAKLCASYPTGTGLAQLRCPTTPGLLSVQRVPNCQTWKLRLVVSRGVPWRPVVSRGAPLPQPPYHPQGGVIGIPK